MKRMAKVAFSAAVIFVASNLLIGCAPGGGLLIRPVSANQELDETVLEKDAGVYWNEVVIVDVDGMIMDARSEGVFSSGENPTSEFVEKLDKARKDDNVKALILRINSPGGGVTASHIMYENLLRFRRAKKVPVIAVIEDVGASGAYYLACGADEIMADKTSLVGSIGVIVETFSLSGTMQKLGIDARAIVSGPYKDMGSPLKPLEEKDRVVLQKIVDDYYNQFVTVVDDGRAELDREQVKTLADGRIYTSDQALANGLIDRQGSLHDAIRLAKERAKIDKAKVVMYHRPMGYRGSVYAGPAVPQINPANLSAADMAYFCRPQFMYLWSGRE
jgi:protease IV